MRYELLTLDVLGNERDGYEINSVYPTGTFLDIRMPLDAAELVALLKKRFPAIQLRFVEIYTAGSGYIEVIRRRDLKPLCHLRVVEEPTTCL